MGERETLGSSPLPDVLINSLDGFTHVVCTRNGLFAVNADAWLKVANGRYYGATVTGGNAVVFESTADGLNSGRILRLDIANPAGFEQIGDGLDSGCHQLDVVRGRLTIIDTHNQELVAQDPAGSFVTVARPLPKGTGRDFGTGYVHLNSILEANGHVYVLAHNGGFETNRPSRVVVLEESWAVIDQFLLPGFGCHNLVVLEDGSILCCDSLQGNLINRTTSLVHVDDLMLRGLSVGDDQVVVGASQYALRPSRRTVPGRVHFLDRSYRSMSVLDLPAAPTEIRRLQGRDLSMSNPSPTSEACQPI